MPKIFKLKLFSIFLFFSIFICSSIFIFQSEVSAATITINVVVINDNGGAKIATDFPVQLNGGNVGLGVATPVVIPSSNTIQETGVNGYAVTSLVCKSNANGANIIPPIVYPATGFSDDVTCTYTNDDVPAVLTITKKIINDNGGTAAPSDFKLLDNGGGTWVSGIKQDTFKGSHTISEVGLTGYTQTSIVCIDSNNQNLGAQPISLFFAQDANCTITNDDQPGNITVVNNVINNNGGTLVAANFPLFLNLAPVTSNVSNTENAGTYTITETQQPGYTQTGIVCVDNSNNASVAYPVVLKLLQSVTCTITNDDKAAHLTVIKTVNNTNGGTKAVADFPLLSNGAAITSNTINTVNPGNYTISETQQTGYTQTSLICKDDVSAATVPNPVVLVLGQSVTCNIVNADLPATITVNKVVTNNNGGTKVISDFPLFVNGAAVTSGTLNSKSAGTYTVSETNLPGYSQSSIACVNAAGATVAHPVVLALGQSVTCTVTNDDIPADLTVNKVVTNTHGGTKVVSDFPLFAGATPITSGTKNTLNAGNYLISETQQTGYIQSSLVCRDNFTAVTLPNPLVLALGQSVTCQITNTDLPAQLTITKVVVNDNGGTRTASSFSLFDNAVSVTSGTKNAVSTGAHAITEGNVTGYTMTSLVCKDDNTSATLTNPLQLNLGQSVTCIFTNDDIAPTITVTKVVTNNNGGTKVVSDFPLKIGATSLVSGVTKAVSAGTFTIAETGSPDYSATYSGDCNATGSITLNPGDVKVCTIANNDYPNLGDYVWVDTDKNGVQDAADTGLNGLTINLYCSGSTTVLLTTTTANNPVGGKPGYYQFQHLDPAKCNYIVEFVKPVGTVFTPKDAATTTDLLDSDADLTTGKTSPITIVMDQDQQNWDTGIYTPAQIGDFVWTDSNVDGVQDTSETGTSCSQGVTVKLTDNLGATVKDVDGVTVASQVTTATGKYLFTNLQSGKYIVTFTPPAGSGCIFTTKDNVAATDLLDSDADNTTGMTAVITLVAGQQVSQWDAGLFAPASVGDYIWQDDNADGIQGTSELGTTCSTGVKVKLTNSTGAVVKDINGLTVADQVTTSSGKYLFTNLLPDNYILTFTPAANSGCIFTPKDVSTTTNLLDNDADKTTGKTDLITLLSGDNQLQWDAGLVQTACIGDRIFEDLNNNGMEDAGEPGIPNVVISLMMPDGTKMDQTSNATGNYAFCNLYPASYKVQVDKTQTAFVKFPDFGIGYTSTTPDFVTKILAPNDNFKLADFGYLSYSKVGDRVFIDKNKDCKFDSVDTPVSGVKLNLKDMSGKTLQTTMTDSSGIYSFTVPSNLAYTLEIDESWKQNSTISKATPTCGVTKTSSTLGANLVYADLDFGFVNSELASTGNSLFTFYLVGIMLTFMSIISILQFKTRVLSPLLLNHFVV